MPCTGDLEERSMYWPPIFELVKCLVPSGDDFCIGLLFVWMWTNN